MPAREVIQMMAKASLVSLLMPAYKHADWIEDYPNKRLERIAAEKRVAPMRTGRHILRSPPLSKPRKYSQAKPNIGLGEPVDVDSTGAQAAA